jgi:hypothetical protein
MPSYQGKTHGLVPAQKNWQQPEKTTACTSVTYNGRDSGEFPAIVKKTIDSHLFNK